MDTGRVSIRATGTRLLLALVFIVLLSAPGLAGAATVTVTNLDYGGAGSLPQAVADANPGDTVNFSPSLTGTITLYDGEIDIAKTLTVEGPGASTLTVSGNNNNRIFDVAAGLGGTVSISGLTLTQGRSDSGGAVRSLAPGVLNLDRVVISSSSSPLFGPGNGGALNTDGTVTITDSTISSNSSTDAAGGVYANSGSSVTITDSTVSANDTGGLGGGIFALGTVQLVRSTVSGNSADNGGGGLYAGTGSSLTVTNSTINSNGGGGLLVTNGGTASLVNSTISANTSPNSGAGIRNDASTLNATNTMLADNTISNFPYPPSDCSGAMGGNNNLVEDPTLCTLSGSGNITGVDPLLGALQDNGGPTQTRAISATSPAINAGTVASCPATDQRGITRPQGSACDIGAFELQTPQNTTLPTITGDAVVGGELSCSQGSWSIADGAVFTKQWYRNSVAIAGQTGQTYQVQSSDEGAVFTCEVTATTVVGAAMAESDGVEIASTPPAPTPQPSPAPDQPVTPVLPAPTASPPELTKTRLQTSCTSPFSVYGSTKNGSRSTAIKRKKGSRKLVLDYALNMDAEVVVTLYKSKRGSSPATCKTKKMRRSKKKPTYRKLFTARATGEQGSNKLTLRLAAGKKSQYLGPGQYKLAVYAKAEGQSSEKHVTRLTVVRRR